MQTINKENHFGVALYGSVLILMLGSAIAGAMASQYFNLPFPSAFRENQPEKVEIVPMDSSSNANMLRKELLDMRHAEAQTIPVKPSEISSLHDKQIQILTLKERMLDVQVPDEAVVTSPKWQELWKEHLDLLTASQISFQPSEAIQNLDAESKKQSAYDRYWAVKAEQIQ